MQETNHSNRSGSMGSIRLQHGSYPGETEIALEVGFADQSHFTRTFKRHLGTPPVEYARLVRPRKKSANQF